MSPTDTRMFIHFDPNKNILPPLLRGPPPHNHISAAPQTEIPRESRGLKRKCSPVPTSPIKRNNYEKKSARTIHNEHDKALTKDQLKTFENMDQAMKALRDSFKQSSDVNFAASYRTHDPGVSHKQRIQTITFEIWKATGYRFTVKDHPRTKDGHKTRLWCSQDETHRPKNSKQYQAPRTSGDGLILAKARFPCRSGLLISSRNDDQRDTFIIIIRMHHHFAHEAYYDHTLPPEMTQSIWERVPSCHDTDSSTQATVFPAVVPNPDFIGSSGSECNPANVHQDMTVNNSQHPRHHEKRPDPLLLPVPQHTVVPPFAPDVFQQRMRQHIANIRSFCDGLEYQLPFNDFRMLEILESEGESFLRLIHQCLKADGSVKASHGTMPLVDP